MRRSIGNRDDRYSALIKYRSDMVRADGFNAQGLVLCRSDSIGPDKPATNYCGGSKKSAIPDPLGGFSFNARRGNDDLDAGSIDPHRLFLIFNEFVEAAHRGVSFSFTYYRPARITLPIKLKLDDERHQTSGCL